MRAKSTRIVVVVLLLAEGLSHCAVAQSPSVALDSQVLEMFVKNALTALNHGNLTGNYSVLRDLGSENFRRQNTAADLAKIFTYHREKHYDLSPILISKPLFTQQPAEIEPGRLQLVGFFPTEPQAVKFALIYRRTAAGWSIDEVSVGMVPLNTLMQAVAPAAPPSTQLPPVPYEARVPSSRPR